MPYRVSWLIPTRKVRSKTYMKRSQLQIIALCTWDKWSSKKNKRVQENNFVNAYRLNDLKNETYCLYKLMS